MKLYAYRALDYLQTSGEDERRYLLVTAVQKAKVSTEGVKVLALLSECIGARGFEAETYFDSALRDAQLIPGLEGSTHINFGLAAQFLDAYFASPAHEVAAPRSLALDAAEPAENPYWVNARDRNAKTVRFSQFLNAYPRLGPIPNVATFTEQVNAFQTFAAGGLSSLNPATDTGLAVAMGRCLSVIAYAQLIAENCHAGQVVAPLVSVIFQGLIEDMSAEALKLSAMFSPDSPERAGLKCVVRVPRTNDADLAAVSELIYGTGGRIAGHANRGGSVPGTQA